MFVRRQSRNFFSIGALETFQSSQFFMLENKEWERWKQTMSFKNIFLASGNIICLFAFFFLCLLLLFEQSQKEEFPDGYDSFKVVTLRVVMLNC